MTKKKHGNILFQVKSPCERDFFHTIEVEDTYTLKVDLGVTINDRSEKTPLVNVVMTYLGDKMVVSWDTSPEIKRILFERLLAGEDNHD